MRSLSLGLPLFAAAALAFGQADKAAKAEQSVRPGINEKFLDPDLKVEEWVQRWEVESREVYTARAEVLRHCGIEKGMRVADVGCGTGLYTRLFSEAVGSDGWVYAVDISARFLGHINAWADAGKVQNVSGVLCREDSVSLPPESVDVVYVCDTYHHFEYPRSSTASILRALKRGGRLIVVDFEKIPGMSREWVMSHVRAGKDVVKKEITDSGFVFNEEVAIPGLVENYFLCFTKR